MIDRMPFHSCYIYRSIACGKSLYRQYTDGMRRVVRPIACCSFLSLVTVKSNDMETDRTKSSRIFFLGTGSSIGTPSLIHLMTDLPDEYHIKNHSVCRKASLGDPRDNKNYRCNPSIVIQHRLNTPDSQNIIIDTGKLQSI